MSLKMGSTARSLGTLYGTSLFVSFGHGMTFPTIPIIAAHFDVSVGWAAQIVTAWALGRLVGTPPAGIIVDRLGARVAMLIGPVFIIVGALSVALSPSFWLVLPALFLAGVGDSTWMIGREIAGVELVRPEQRGRMMSGFMGVNSAGMALGPALGGILADAHDFRVVFLGYMSAAIVVLVLSLFARVGPAAPRKRAAAAPALGPSAPAWWSPKRIAGIPDLVRQIEPGLRSTYLVLVFATFTMMLYRMVFQSMMPLYVVTQRGFTATEFGFLLSVQGIIVVLMIFPAGLIMDKLGRKWAMVPSTGIPAISFLLIPFADSYLELVALVGLMGLANGLSLGSVATSTYDVIPAAARGRLQALRRTVSEVGGISGPLAGGVIAGAANPGVPFLATAPILVIASFLLLFVAKETLVKKREPVDRSAL
jgi:MFS family permease